jgi:hypothetical protein
MSHSSVYTHRFDLLERIHTEIKSFLSTQGLILKELFEPFIDPAIIKSQKDYRRLAELALGSIETLDVEKCPLRARETSVRKIGESEPSQIQTGYRYRFKIIDSCVAGLYLFAGAAFFLSADFILAIQALKKVGEHVDKGTDSSRFLLGLAYFFIENREEAAYFTNLSAATCSGELLHRITFFSIKRDYSRVKYSLESFSTDLARTLSFDPLLLYFYSDAVFQLGAYHLFEKTLKTLFHDRFKDSQKYYFLQPHLEYLYEKFMLADRTSHEAFGAGEGSSSFRFTKKLSPLKSLVERVRGGTGGSPLPLEDDSEGGTPMTYSDSDYEESPKLDGLSIVEP